MAQDGRSRDRANASIEPARRQRGSKHAADPRWTLVACVLASSLSFVEGSVLSVALAGDPRELRRRRQEVQWVVNAYLLPLSALLLLGGALGDHFGRRRLLVIGTAIFASTSLVCALAPSLPVLLAARAAQGIGAALLLPNSLALAQRRVPGREARTRGRHLGGGRRRGRGDRAADRRLAGGHVGWPAIFYINLPLALGAILLALRFVAESREAGAGRTDYAGALLATAGLGGLTYALTLWSATRSSTADRRRAVARRLVLLAAFLWAEHGAASGR